MVLGIGAFVGCEFSIVLPEVAQDRKLAFSGLMIRYRWHRCRRWLLLTWRPVCPGPGDECVPAMPSLIRLAEPTPLCTL